MGVQDLKVPLSSSNGSNNGEVGICPATQTFFRVQPISQVLEVQMTLIFFPGNLRQYPITFMI